MKTTNKASLFARSLFQILVHGVADATEHLADYCRQNSSIHVNQVFTPQCGETVDSTGERYIYQVREKEQALYTMLSSASSPNASP